MSFTAIVAAAGSGTRAGGAKQWMPLRGRPLVRWSVEAFIAAGADDIIVVVPDGGQAQAAQALAGLTGWRWVVGGAERTASVQAGLALAAPDRPVLVHDAARPLVARRHVAALLQALETADAAAPALAVDDTLKAAEDSIVARTVDRTGLWRVQTPQAFAPGVLQRAYGAWTGGPLSDDLALVEALGGRVVLTPGDPALMKLTRLEDLAVLEALAPGRMTVRTGLGVDAHRWGPGTAVWLCGVPITHDQTLIGHSDADAGLHALTDAILGALGDGDIGDHFPPSDPQWKGAASDRFLVHAVERVTARGGRLLNVDVTLICEAPRIKPHRQAMRERLSQLTGLSLDAVSVKATTMEGMGFTGRGEGLAAQALATVELPA